jgi:isochorismate pyruvate lyase
VHAITADGRCALPIGNLDAGQGLRAPNARLANQKPWANDPERLKRLMRAGAPARQLRANEETIMGVKIIFAVLCCLLAGSAHAEEPATDKPAAWGNPTVNNCRTLGEVRSNIDRLDKEIVRLIAERSRYVHEAARFKANPAQVEAPERAEAVVRKAMATAEQDGLPPKIAEATYRAMIRAFIEYEQEVFSAGAAAGQAPWRK